MKRLILGVCSIVIILILASCGTTNSNTTNGSDPQSQEVKSITTKLEAKREWQCHVYD